MYLSGRDVRVCSVNLASCPGRLLMYISEVLSMESCYPLCARGIAGRVLSREAVSQSHRVAGGSIIPIAMVEVCVKGDQGVTA